MMNINNPPLPLARPGIGAPPLREGSIPTEYEDKKHALRARFCVFMAGDEGFEPPNGGTRTHCLTTWRIPNG